jgi:uroporphyrinogen decarboxylase
MSLTWDAIPIHERRATIGRFNDRVDAAEAAAAPSKAWAGQAIRHAGGPRPPVRLRRLTHDVVLRYPDALADLFVRFPDDVIHLQPYDMFFGYQPPDTEDPVDPIRCLTESATWVDEWGTGWEHAAGGSGASPISAPIAEWDDLDAYLRRRMPDAAAPGRFDALLPRLAAVGPSRYVVGTTHCTLWERYNQLRGMGAALEDMAEYPPEAGRLLDAIVEFQVGLIRRWGALGGVDAVMLADDFGTQRSLIMSPATWRRVFAARYRRICDAAHERGLAIVFHSCGNVAPIIGDLIDAGVDVLDPLQEEAMDLAWVAREFGGKVAFAGGLPEQTLPHLAPEAVRDAVHRMIDLMGRPFGNAYILAPSNSLLADVPLANLEALFEACRDG